MNGAQLAVLMEMLDAIYLSGNIGREVPIGEPGKNRGSEPTAGTSDCESGLLTINDL